MEATELLVAADGVRNDGGVETRERAPALAGVDEFTNQDAVALTGVGRLFGRAFARALDVCAIFFVESL